jgi:hypothetical protein
MLEQAPLIVDTRDALRKIKGTSEKVVTL